MQLAFFKARCQNKIQPVSRRRGRSFWESPSSPPRNDATPFGVENHFDAFTQRSRWRGNAGLDDLNPFGIFIWNNAWQSRRDCNHPAQGCEERATLGHRPNKFINPERVASIPHIPLVKFNGVAFQEFPKFILKRNLPVMLLLSGNIITHRLDLRKSNGEYSIAILPSKIMQVGAFGFQPER